MLALIKLDVLRRIVLRRIVLRRVVLNRCGVWAGLMLLALTASAQAQPVAGVSNFYQFSQTLATGGLVEEGALVELKAQGYTQIVDLRRAEEGVSQEQAAAEALGLTWVHLPTGGELPDAERIQTFGELLTNGKTLVHCRSGNRVGMTWALWQLSQGVALETALAEGRAMGMKSGFEQAIRAQVAAQSNQ